MHLDVITLMVAGCFMAALAALLLAGAWSQMRDVPAVAWWAGSFFIYAVGIGTLAVGFGTDLTLPKAVGGLVTSASAVVLWAGTRVFEQRRILKWQSAVWLVPVAAAAPFPQGPRFVGFLVWVVYLAASIVELSWTRTPPSRATWALIGLFALHAFVFAAGSIEVVTGAFPSGDVPPIASWFGLVHVETLIYSIGAAFFMFVMCKERVETRNLAMARLDALTGLPNRGPFIDAAKGILARAELQRTPAALIMLDVDYFKSINDGHGHAAGDEVLRVFADLVRGLLRTQDVVGRYGGEEFVIVLPEISIEAAYAIAERIRYRTATTSVHHESGALKFTVSGGVASVVSGMTFDESLHLADKALYRAKRLGRNRIERAATTDQQPVKIIRLA